MVVSKAKGRGFESYRARIFVYENKLKKIIEKFDTWEMVEYRIGTKICGDFKEYICIQDNIKWTEFWNNLKS